MHARPILLFALSALYVVPGGEPEPPAEEAVARVYDLSGLCVPYDGRDISERAFPVLVRDNEDDSGDRRELDYELPRTLLRHLLAGDIEAEGVVLEELSGERLAVRAGPAVHQRLQNALAELDRTLAGTLELELSMLRLEGASDLHAGLVPDAQAQAWIETARAAGRLERLALRVGRGTAATVDVGREVEYLGDFDVEVAEGALTFDPQMLYATLGTRVSARASAGRDGHFLALSVRRASATGPVSRRTLERGTAMLAGDSYRVDSRAVAQESLPVLGRSLALNAWLPNGSAWVATLAHDAGGVGEALVVRVVGGGFGPTRRLEGGPGGRALTLLDVTRWSPPAAWSNVLEALAEAHGLRLRHPSYGSSDFWLGTAPYARDVDGGDVVESALSLLGSEPEVSEGGWPWRAVDLGADAARVVERLEELVPQGANIVAELALRRGERVLAHLALPLLVGRSSDVVLCSEELYVAEADVEIAKFSSVEDPVQRARLEGLLVSLRPLRTPSGAILLELGGMGVASAGTRRTIELADEGSGELEGQDQDYLRLDELLRSERNRGTTTVRIGDGTTGLALDVTF